jgi:cytidylate kinase
MVGRDIGTVVMPNADLKIYLDATTEERIQRRYREACARGGSADYDAVAQSVYLRDEIDSNRALAPLRAAPDAVVIDTTPLNVEQVVERILSLVEDWRQPH